MQIRVALLGAALSLLCLIPAVVVAQGSGSRSAAAEAYDRGTAAYLDGSYEKAAQWFETANRLAPAAPALMQAVRAHHKGGNTLKASSLALRLKLEYSEEPAAVQFADSILEENGAQYVQVKAQCEACSLEVDGGVQEYPVFLVEPGVSHTVAATFDTGTVDETVDANAGETVELSFEAPPPPPPVVEPNPVDGAAAWGAASHDEEPKGMTPVVFFIGAGVTVGLAIGAIVVGLSANAAVEDYNAAADEYIGCNLPNCDAAMSEELRDDAEELLDVAQGKRTTSTVLWVTTGVVAAATATIGIFFTNWKGKPDSNDSARLDFDVAPLRGGAFASLKGSF